MEFPFDNNTFPIGNMIKEVDQIFEKEATPSKPVDLQPSLETERNLTPAKKVKKPRPLMVTDSFQALQFIDEAKPEISISTAYKELSHEELTGRIQHRHEKALSQDKKDDAEAGRKFDLQEQSHDAELINYMINHDSNPA